MEISGSAFRSVPYSSGVGIDTHSSKSPFSSLSFAAGNQFSGELKLHCSRDSKVSGRRSSGFSNSVFSDKGHLRYYVSSPVCGGIGMKKKKKKKNPEMVALKKKLKLIKGLSKDLSMFSSMGFGVNTDDGLIAQVKGKTISEATEVLLAQLKLLKAEEKELKRKRKEEKARLKLAVKIGNETGYESSSSSGSSSDGEVVDMSRLRTGNLMVDDGDDKFAVEAASLTNTSLVLDEQMTMEVHGDEKCTSISEIHRHECCNGNTTSTTTSTTISSSSNGTSVDQSIAVVAQSNQKIEVCMGGKCKKSGAAALMEEFEKKVGIAGAVVGCKCMGKCRDGPNIRVLNHCSGNVVQEMVVDVDKPTKNPLCIGVGLQDVGTIIASFFGDEMKDFGMMATT